MSRHWDATTNKGDIASALVAGETEKKFKKNMSGERSVSNKESKVKGYRASEKGMVG